MRGILEEESEHIDRIVQEKPLGISDETLYLNIIRKFNSAVLRDIKVDESDVDPVWRGETISYSEDEDIYQLQMLYGKGFRKRFLLERLLWRQLRRRLGGAMDDALIRIARSLAKERSADGSFVNAIRERLNDAPLVFINLSWIPGNKERDLVNHKRGYSRSSLHFHDGKAPVRIQAEPRVKSRDEDYFITICAPRLLLETEGMSVAIIEVFERILKDRLWILPDQFDEFV